jgi:hypothetical protein
MTVISLVTDYIGTPNNYAGEVILYTLGALILLVVIEELVGLFHAMSKQIK